MSQAPARESDERAPDVVLPPRILPPRDFGLKAEAARRTAQGVARYRAAHAGATGSDKVIALLAALAAEFGRQPK